MNARVMKIEAMITYFEILPLVADEAEDDRGEGQDHDQIDHRVRHVLRALERLEPGPGENGRQGNGRNLTTDEEGCHGRNGRNLAAHARLTPASRVRRPPCPRFSR